LEQDEGLAAQRTGSTPLLDSEESVMLVRHPVQIELRSRSAGLDEPIAVGAGTDPVHETAHPRHHRLAIHLIEIGTREICWQCQVADGDLVA
jgi:hypothetical protein